MEKHYNISEGAELSCSKGTARSHLKIKDSHGARIGGKREATVNDCQADSNIQPFGTCRLSGEAVACRPVILKPWLLGNKGYQINGEPALMSNSILSCACGGIIKIH